MKQRNDLILIAQGAYSDYQNTAFRVLKPFTMAEVEKLFMAQFKPRNAIKVYPEASEFIGWLTVQGYIEDACIVEINVGDYGLDIDSEAAHFQFEPSKETA